MGSGAAGGSSGTLGSVGCSLTVPSGEAQKKLSSKYPDAQWDFKKEGQILKETYGLVKDANPHLYADAQDFSVAAAEFFARRKAKLADKEAT